MKSIKKVFLGSAAGLVAIFGAQAADLPVKAKPVQYVKICDLYGGGFYYIPGSDVCIRIGGYIRADYYWNASGGGSPNYTGANGRQTRATDDLGTRHRANVMIDTRQNTQYGVLRTLMSLHVQNQNNGVDSTQVQRAFIQYGGFTFGHAQSFVDIFFLDPYQFATPYIGDNTDGNGTNLAAYTYQFQDGLTFTAAIEEARRGGLGRSLTNLSNPAALVVGSAAVDSSRGATLPDFEGALRYDQKWGSIGAFAVGHLVSATYYTAATPGFAACTGGFTGTTFCDHPADKMGWAAGFGGTINLPELGTGDKIGAQFTYANGASAYAANGHNSAGLFGGGNQVAAGWATDGVYVNGSAIELTTAWSVIAAYEHNWSPLLKTSLYGAYLHVDYDTTATNYFCVTGTAAAVQAAFNTLSSCNPDYSVYYVGSRTMWSPVKDLIIGADVYFTGVKTGFAGTANLGTNAIGPRPTSVYTLKNLGIVSAVFRAQRNF